MHCKLFHDWASVWTLVGEPFNPESTSLRPPEETWQINCLRCGKIKEKKVTT